MEKEQEIELAKMLSSHDKSLVRLAQKICHAREITYYVIYRPALEGFWVASTWIGSRGPVWLSLYDNVRVSVAGEIPYSTVVNITYDNQHEQISTNKIVIHKIDFSWRKK